MNRAVGFVAWFVAFSVRCALVTAPFMALSTGVAQAAPIDGKAIVCDTLDTYGVTTQSLRWIVDYLKDQRRLSVSDAAGIIDVSIIFDCPWHQSAWQEWGRQTAKQLHPDNPLF